MEKLIISLFLLCPLLISGLVNADVNEESIPLEGKKVLVNGSEVKGNVQIQTLSPTSTTFLAGYYNSTDLAIIDSDLTANNIRKAKEVYGVKGTVGIAWGCTPGSGEWVQTKCETDCDTDMGGAFSTGCPTLCENISEAFATGFIPAVLGATLKTNFCGGQ